MIYNNNKSTMFLAIQHQMEKRKTNKLKKIPFIYISAGTGRVEQTITCGK